MNKQHNRTPGNATPGRVWAGIIIVCIGAVLLAGRLGLDWLFPHWLFSWRNMWPMILIVVGLIIGGNSNFRNPASYILLGIGAFFLLRNFTHFDIGHLFWPAVIIGIGLWLLLGKGRTRPCPPGPGSHTKFHRQPEGYEWDKRIVDDTDTKNSPGSSGATAFNETGEDPYSTTFTRDDYLKSTSVFSDVKKTIISKRFQGGEIVNICGGTDINLVQADIHHPIVIDVFQLFAGMKIIVPSHWKIQSEMVSVFGEVDDKRFTQGMSQDDQKVVYIKGTSIFGGITIKNI